MKQSPFKYEWIRSIAIFLTRLSCNMELGLLGTSVWWNPKWLRWLENKLANIPDKIWYILNQ